MHLKVKSAFAKSHLAATYNFKTPWSPHPKYADQTPNSRTTFSFLLMNPVINLGCQFFFQL